MEIVLDFCCFNYISWSFYFYFFLEIIICRIVLKTIEKIGVPGVTSVS